MRSHWVRASKTKAVTVTSCEQSLAEALFSSLLHPSDMMQGTRPQMLLQLLSMLYLLPLYFYWKKRWAQKENILGRRASKRLQRCAPQLLLRAWRKELEFQRCVRGFEDVLQHEYCKDVLHYSFCYYYGMYCGSASQWIVAACCVFCKYSGRHAELQGQCHMLSLWTWFYISCEHRFGPYLGFLLASTLPMFSPCSVPGCIFSSRLRRMRPISTRQLLSRM